MTRKPSAKLTLSVSSRKEWRSWLKQRYTSEPVVWLVYYKKHSGKPRISYNDAVEEALCFGWIDSTLNTLDENRFAQRFSPRKPRSAYSQANKERLRALAKRRKLMPEILALAQEILAEEDDFQIPVDILSAIKKNPRAWRFFQRYSPAYVRIRISFVEKARKRPQEFRKRLRYLLQMTEKGKQFGFGGIERHY
jgi:uncharacterized protein YdeI (YjbR/CyaY-like superfamily)